MYCPWVTRYGLIFWGVGVPFTTANPGGGEGGRGYSHTLPIQVCAAQRGRDFEAPDLARGTHFRGVF